VIVKTEANNIHLKKTGKKIIMRRQLQKPDEGQDNKKMMRM
jgi:hypothetical protein